MLGTGLLRHVRHIRFAGLGLASFPVMSFAVCPLKLFFDYLFLHYDYIDFDLE